MVLQHGGRRLAEAARNHGGEPGEDETGDDFIQTQPAVLFPDHHRDGPHKHARQRAIACHARPEQRQDDDRAECRAETGPGIADHAEHLGFRVAGNHDGDQRNRHHHGAADPHQFGLAGILAQESAVDVLCQRAGADQQLARQRAHHGGQDGSQQQAGDPGVEQLLGHLDEDGFGVGIHRQRAARMRQEIRNADEPDRDRAGQAQDHPGHADTTRGRNGRHRFSGHEAHQDVRLAEITQAPGHQRDDADEGSALHHVQLGRLHQVGDRLRGLQAAGHGEIAHHRRHDQRGDHERCLDRVGPAHGQEAADEHIGDGAGSAHPQRGLVRQAEHVLEQPRPGHHARGAVHGEEHQDHHGGEDAQQVGLVLEAVGKVVGQRQRIAGPLGVQPQPRRDETPVEVGADDQANGDPGFAQARQVNRAGQAHQQPAAHVGSAGRQGSDKAAQAAATQNVVVEVVGAAVTQEADEQHGKQVDAEHDHGGIGKVHEGLLKVDVIGRKNGRGPSR